METIFKVEEVINSNIIRVSPPWVVGGKTGDKIFIRGYDLESYAKKNNHFREESLLLGEEIAKMRLSALTYDKRVEIKNLPYHIPESIDKNGALKCNVYIDNKNISTFFGDFN